MVKRHRFISRLFFLCVGILFLGSCESYYFQTRKIEDFNSHWEFALTPDEASYEGIWRTLSLPHDWSIEGPFSKDNAATPGGGALPGGIGCYRKMFALSDLKEGQRVFVEFDGIYRNSSIYLNDKQICERPYGYSSFCCEITPYLNPPGEENKMVVIVDNSQQPNSRWYSGSGIYRNVRLVTTKTPVAFVYNSLLITTTAVSTTSATVRTTVAISNHADEAADYYVLLQIRDSTGKRVAEDYRRVKIPTQDERTFSSEIELPKPLLWDVEHPQLYTMECALLKGTTIIDNLIETFGVRSVRMTPDEGFMLNEVPVKLKGVCMHHDLGALGAAVNTRAMERQLELLKEMGCNAIRTSHNPPAPEWLDLCDRMGFLVMDETFDVWRKSKSKFDYASDFDQWHERDIQDHIRRDMNHPSVVMWSIGNEVMEQWENQSDREDLDLQQANLLINFKKYEKGNLSDTMSVASYLTRKLVALVREIDISRPITAGCNDPSPTNNLFKAGALDVIGLNYNDSHYKALHERYPNKPLIATETVSALQTRGFYQMPSDSIRIEPKQWWLSYDTPHMSCSAYDNMHVPWGNTHEQSWLLVKNNPYVAGTFVWTGFDYLGEPTPYWWPARSSYFGIIDLAGFPKDVYYMYQSEWTQKPVLHIFPHWNWKSGQDIDVWAYYSQADSVCLFLNEKPLGARTKTDNCLHAWWRVPFEPGTLRAISYRDGKEVLQQEVTTAGEATQIRLTPDRTHLQADGRDLCFVTVEIADKEGHLVPNAQSLVQFSVQGPAIIAAVDNGSPFSHEPFQASQCKAFHGKCLVILEVTKEQGQIQLTAKGEDLSPMTVSMESMALR